MGFLKKIFGAGDPLARVRRARQQRRWADALLLGEEIDQASLDAAGQAELAEILLAAGNALAELNLEEGEAFLRSGDPGRAREHFRLAAAQARSETIAATARDRLQRGTPEAALPIVQTSSGACGGHCHPSVTSETAADDSVLPDTRTRLELIVAAYPAELAERCLHLQGPFLAGFLAAHDDRPAAALQHFEQVPAEERDDMFYFERGALLARMQDIGTALADLEKSVSLNPAHELALMTLAELESATDEGLAERRLQGMLAAGRAAAFAHGRLALLFARRGRHEEALGHVQQALAGGNDPECLLLAASLLEKLDRLDEAEAVLRRLPAGGCGGGQVPNLPLAEFWLRRRKNLDRAMEAFTRALHRDGNPRWQLRMAEVYIAKGKQEGEVLLEQILATDGLDPAIAREAKSLLADRDPEVLENSRSFS